LFFPLHFFGNASKLDFQLTMIGQRHCPFCKTSALNGCRHLALACEAREFVRRCVTLAQGETPWRQLCEARRQQMRQGGEWSPEREDFTWLETAFCDEFLKKLLWFGGLDYEWRTGPKGDQGGFWVLLWSQDAQRLWWELRDEFERQLADCSSPQFRGNDRGRSGAASQFPFNWSSPSEGSA
jgi:hypothetical protein